MNSICVASSSACLWYGRGGGGAGGHVALEGTLYSRVTCPGGRVTLVQSVRGDTVHWGTDSTPTTYTRTCNFGYTVHALLHIQYIVYYSVPVASRLRCIESNLIDHIPDSLQN